MILRRTGFTLLELMIVIAIIGMIATVLYPQLIGYYSRGRDAVRLTDIKTLSANFQNYARGQSVYPSNSNKDGEISYCISDIAGWIDALPQFRDKQFSALGGTGKLLEDPLATHPNLGVCNPTTRTTGSYFYSQLSGAGGMYGLVAARMENQATGANYKVRANLTNPGAIDSMLKAQPLDKSGNDDDKIYLLITN